MKRTDIPLTSGFFQGITDTPRRADGSALRRRTDRAHRHASRALEVALCQHANGSFNALAWCAAGMPNAIEPHDLEWFQTARAIVHANSGTIKPGDADRLAATMRRKGVKP